MFDKRQEICEPCCLAVSLPYRFGSGLVIVFVLHALTVNQVTERCILDSSWQTSSIGYEVLGEHFHFTLEKVVGSCKRISIRRSYIIF